MAPEKADEIVVFSVIADSACAECGTEILKGDFLRMEVRRPLCLACADLDHLFFLPRGDAALTRRAGKHSRLRALVVRFSRSRGRYERQGILVEESALACAEAECLADTEARALSRERSAKRRAALDEAHVREFGDHIGEIFPGCPMSERSIIAEHACQKYTGRIGRSAAARRFDPEAVHLAVNAHIRHAHTDYDALLMKGRDRRAARAAIAAEVDAMIETWSRSTDAMLDR